MAVRMKKKTNKVKKIVNLAKKSRKNPVAKTNTHIASKTGVKIKMPAGKYIEAIGRRKTATARVRIYQGQNNYIVNDKVVGDYFAAIPNAHLIYNQAFDITETKGKFAVTAKVSGSGLNAQIHALVHGISRALVKFDPELIIHLKKVNLLSRDDRMKETRKPGKGGKARRKRQSPKR